MTPIAITEIPAPNPKRLALRVQKPAERALRHGHPWLFDQAITQQSGEGQAGDLAVIFTEKGKFVAIGLYDPNSPLRVRLLAHETPVAIDEAWWEAKITAVVQQRASLETAGHTGYRLIFGEGDGLPGLIVDRYGESLVLKLYSAVWFPYLRYILPALYQNLPQTQHILLRLSRNIQQGETFGWQDGDTLSGESAAEPAPFVENGLRFVADVRHGHKTGFFFDQRENRQRVRELSHGRTVLDLFSYTGGFALCAAAGGATAVTAVDISQPALLAAQENFRLNQDNPAVAACRFTPVVADVFAQLRQYGRARQQFDMVIVDPPSFAKSAAEHGRALQAYAQLVQLALPCVSPKGLLVIASCTSRVNEAEWLGTIYDTAVQLGRPLRSQAVTGHPLDHPVLPSFPEGRYLKCLFASPID